MADGDVQVGVLSHVVSRRCLALAVSQSSPNAIFIDIEQSSHTCPRHNTPPPGATEDIMVAQENELTPAFAPFIGMVSACIYSR